MKDWEFCADGEESDLETLDIEEPDQETLFQIEMHDPDSYANQDIEEFLRTKTD